MKKITFIFLLLLSVHAVGQTSDDAFKEPLKNVISRIRERYQVAIRYPEELVKDRFVTYAGWRFTPDAEKTMANIFASQDITFVKEGDRKYKLQAYQYHLKTPEEGKLQLDYFATLYNDLRGWEKRKAVLKKEILSALRLQPLPVKPASAPITTPVRKMNGYTVQNIAIETLPGLYVCGSVYRPVNAKGKLPVILNPDGHFDKGRYRADSQYRCAMLARMGAIAMDYDLFAWGESLLQFKTADHRRAIAQSIQALNGMRILDYLLSLRDSDPSRVAITGGSGGGSQTMLLSAIDDRFTLSVSVVMLSSYHSGGCPCESGMGTHLCGGGTNNVEIAAMSAPKPQLVISDGKDWTQNVPQTEFPFLQKIYGFYGRSELAENAHFPGEGHDYGLSKRLAMYRFIAGNFHLDLKKIGDANGKIDETPVTIETEAAQYVFGEKGEKLPANAIRSFADLEKIFTRYTTQ
ncbi:alpha/beta hydrolase family protein [Hufsiella ginkgonis]|uniref:Acetylxylan esterase n=1 Tax=Hufsiella ginkgonis TaxID=2695274 RepID=A0A7K1XW47_9SPHI|nr:acetylxylan esterase [Hufsiella ginkgonis]MXV15213.1 acetylxylan esterase [Hufsiella ginkgonis]